MCPIIVFYFKLSEMIERWKRMDQVYKKGLRLYLSPGIWQECQENPYLFLLDCWIIAQGQQFIRAYWSLLLSFGLSVF